jgi:hypothetical protein
MSLRRSCGPPGVQGQTLIDLAGEGIHTADSASVVLGVDVVIAASNKLGGTGGEKGAEKETGKEPISLENAQRSYVTQHTQQPHHLLDLA